MKEEASRSLFIALSANPKAKALFQKLPPSHQREYLHWISAARKAETAQRRIASAISMLSAKADQQTRN